jgi:hypothetical protein
MTADTPRTAAGRELLAELRAGGSGASIESSARDRVLAIEAAAAAEETALLSELVEAGEVVPPRGSAGWKPSDVRVQAWENAQEKARLFLAAR